MLQNISWRFKYDDTDKTHWKCGIWEASKYNKPEEKKSDTIKVSGTGILVRDRAGTEGSNLVGSIDAGEYKNLGQEGDYYYIQFSDDKGAHTGYINKQFVTN